MIPLIVIEGPTASGKSEVAIQLAESFQTEIISADSRQIYRQMDIGTAKPSLEERERVTHHLIDIIDPDQEYNAGNFSSSASEIITNLHISGKIPVVCGGTGFYIKALLEGLFAVPEIPKEIREELETLEKEKGKEYLYQMLLKVDPQSAEKIHSNDCYRIKRALEVWIVTGRGIRELWKEQAKDQVYKPFRLMVSEERAPLYERINLRMERMIKEGLIEEIRILLARYSEDVPGLKSVGYREFIPFLKRGIPFLNCLEEAKQATRNYAKRQFTWYRKVSFDRVIESKEFKASEIKDLIKKSLDIS